MHFHIEGLPPYDGDHPIDLDTFTNRELHIIKEIAGVRAAELDEAWRAGDNDLTVAFCVIALRRAGFEVNENSLWDAEIGAIKLVAGDDAGPPTEAGQQTSEPGGSGGDSSLDGGRLANGQSPTGSRSSDTGSASAPATLAS